MLACLMALAVAQDESPRLITQLQNGAKIVVESLPKAETFSISIFGSTRGIEDTPKNCGARHLLEHLMMTRKVDGKPIDEVAESGGVLLTASTYRDCLQIEARGPAGKFSFAFGLLKSVVQPISPTADELAREIQTIRSEMALAGSSRTLVDHAWRVSFGDRGLNPSGDVEAMSKLTPPMLESLSQLQWQAPRVAVAIAGPLPKDQMSETARLWLGAWPSVEPAQAAPPRAFKPERLQVTDGYGELRATVVGDFTSPGTAASLVAAFAVSTSQPGSFLSYVPCESPGLISIGSTESNNKFLTWLDNASDESLVNWFKVGQSLAKRWLRQQLDSPSSNTSLRGRLLCGNSGRPEQLEELLERVTWSDFKSAVENLKKGKATTVVGVGQ